MSQNIKQYIALYREWLIDLYADSEGAKALSHELDDLWFSIPKWRREDKRLNRSMVVVMDKIESRIRKE